MGIGRVQVREAIQGGASTVEALLTIYGPRRPRPRESTVLPQGVTGRRRPSQTRTKSDGRAMPSLHDPHLDPMPSPEDPIDSLENPSSWQRYAASG